MLTWFHLAGEAAINLIQPPGDTGVEWAIINAVQWLKLAVETTGSVVIAIGIFTAAYEFVRASCRRSTAPTACARSCYHR
jgi:hypothetical protein